MKLSIHEIAGIIKAEVAGDASCKVDGVSSFEDALPTQITFASEPKFLNQLSLTQAKAIIVPESFDFNDSDFKHKTLLKALNPKISFFDIVNIFHPPKKTDPFLHHSAVIGKSVSIGKMPKIHAKVVIGDQVVIGDNVCLMPGVYVGDDVSIGDNTVIKPNVSIMEKSRIGKNVIIHPGTVIGSDGFGFAQSNAPDSSQGDNRENSSHHKLIHTGYVTIGDDTEIGACNTIDRGTLGTTVIGCGVKTDNQVHIAHNVKIGDNTLLVAQVGIAGSTTVGNNVIIAGKTGVTGHIKIGDNTIIGPYSGVTADVAPDQIVSGLPHMPHRRWLKMSRILSRLPEMRKKLFSFEKRLTHIENKNKRTEKK